MDHFDAIVVGGGLFGCHAALWLADRGASVAIIEQDQVLIQRASIVNQARLHAGYHYPRSIATARSSDSHIDRFRQEHQDCINDDFTHYYAIARRGSFTDAGQFQNFCEYIGLKCDPITDHSAFNYDQLAAVFEAREDSFDPILLADKYRLKVQQAPKIEVLTAHRLQQAEILPRKGEVGQRYRLIVNGVGEVRKLATPLVVNATYAAINVVNQIFGLPLIPLQHEIAEMAFFYPGAAFSQAALTVMDGPFCSFMPYGKTGMHTLSSVAYTHQRVSYGELAAFPECQEQNPQCSPMATADCSTCQFRPASNYPKMLAQLRRYLHTGDELEYLHSRFTIKAKLQTNFIDDGRPTAVRKLSSQPGFLCVFAGKINSVYSLEPLLESLWRDA